MFFETEGSACTKGHGVQHQWSWGDGNSSDWLPPDNGEYTWDSPGSYELKVRARCSQDNAVMSGWSESLGVTIEEAEEPPLPDWVVVGRWKGTRTRTTETFYVDAGEWRVRWSLRYANRRRGFDPWVDPWVYIQVRDSEDRRVDSVMGDALHGVSRVHHGPGRYFLQLTGGRYTEWEVTAEVRRSE